MDWSGAADRPLQKRKKRGHEHNGRYMSFSVPAWDATSQWSGFRRMSRVGDGGSAAPEASGRASHSTDTGAGPAPGEAVG